MLASTGLKINLSIDNSVAKTMALYGAFAAPALGMLTQSSAFGTISQNITNLNTGGYKSASTRFTTVLASTFDANSDIGGVRAFRKENISIQGRLLSSTNNLDIAINGSGLFTLNSDVTGSGDDLYTRDGAFQLTKIGTDTVTTAGGSSVIVDKAYLTDKNGHFVQGWTPNASGVFATSSTPGAIRLDQNAFNSEAAASTKASLAINLPATASPGDTKITKASAYDSAGTRRSFELVWTRGTLSQQWDLHVRSAADAEPDTAVTSASTTPNLSTPKSLTFDSTGHLPAGTTVDVAVNYATNPDLSFTLDVENVTSIGGQFLYFDFQADGRAAGTLKDYKFDTEGQIVGQFTNGTERALYKLPLATFVNPDGLEVIQGNLYAASGNSGTVTLRQVRDPLVTVDTTTGNNQERFEFAFFVPHANELANTNLQNEFNNMIMTQQAYNSAATLFSTVDEMTRTAANLKT
jgi:flagellar hook protein FlgE